MQTALSPLARLDEPEAASAWALLMDLYREALAASVDDSTGPEPRSYHQSVARTLAAQSIFEAISGHLSHGNDLLLCPPIRSRANNSPLHAACEVAQIEAFARLTAVVLEVRAAVARGAAEMAVAGIDVEAA